MVVDLPPASDLQNSGTRATTVQSHNHFKWESYNIYTNKHPAEFVFENM